MNKHAMRGLLLAAAMLTVLSAVAAPAGATLTSRASRGISARSRGATFTYSDGSFSSFDNDLTCVIDGGINDGNVLTCRLDFRNVVGTINNLSASLTCIATTISLTVTSSVTNMSASMDMTITRQINCRDIFGAVTITIPTPQTIRGCVTYTVATRRSRFRCAGIRATINSSAVTATFTGDFDVTGVDSVS